MKKHIFITITPRLVGIIKTVRNKFFYVCKRKDSSIPYIFFKDPITKIKLPNARFSVEKLNQMISRPVEVFDDSAISYIGFSIIQEGLLTKLLEPKAKKKPDKEKEVKKEEPLFNDYILNFWDYENSWYFRRERELRGRNLTESYCKNQEKSFRNHCINLIPEGLKLKDFTVELMETIQFDMREKGFSGRTINEATNSIRKALGEAFKHGDIDIDIAQKLTGVKNNTKERGILTEEEGEKLLKHLKNTTTPNTSDRWKYLVCAIGYYTGMRIGEIEALQEEDLDKEKNIIHVNHSWSTVAGLKTTKNGKTRKTFPISPILMKEIAEYSKLNKKNPFIFSAKKSEDKPLSRNDIDEAFNKALNDIGISEEERKRRVIVFHSLRHGFVSNALASGVSFDIVEKGAGHLTKAMTEHYTHETEKAEAKYIEATKQAIKYVE